MKTYPPTPEHSFPKPCKLCSRPTTRDDQVCDRHTVEDRINQDMQDLSKALRKLADRRSGR